LVGHCGYSNLGCIRWAGALRIAHSSHTSFAGQAKSASNLQVLRSG
jgi:hypothetical protein